jgi:RNA polymerase sigma-70 factor (ECF subfamily)
MLTFEELYQTHFKDVYRFALWLSRDQSEAEDMTSETFVRAWARRHRLRTETLKAYLLAIARRIFLDHRRRASNNEGLPGELRDGAPDPHRQAAARMDLDRVQRVMSQLPEPDRVALVLRAEHSLPYAEIARVLEISEGAARVKVHRARRKLLDAYLTRPKEVNDGSNP